MKDTSGDSINQIITSLRGELAARRRQSNLSQREIARRMGVTENYFGQLERGVVKIVHIELLFRWADALEMNFFITLQPRGQSSPTESSTESDAIAA